MGTAFIQRFLNTLFNRKQKDNVKGDIKGQISNRNKVRCKASKINSKSKANIKKEEYKAETVAETEEKIRSCALEVKTCIDLINNSTCTPDKPKGVHGPANADNRKAVKSAGKLKTASDSNLGTKRGRQDVSPAEMVTLLAKVEEKVSEAVVKAKEKDDKKKKGSRKKRT
jgi:hypothetical protein